MIINGAILVFVVLGFLEIVEIRLTLTAIKLHLSIFRREVSAKAKGVVGDE